jgi:large subunit ribosomal protein L19
LQPFFENYFLKLRVMSKKELLKYVEDQVVMQELPKFKAGDTVTVTYKIVEGSKERLQNFQGVVLQRVGGGATETFTVRKISSGIGVERIFPIASPFIDAIKVNKRGVVRRARIFYLRGLTGKKARIKEKRM